MEESEIAHAFMVSVTLKKIILELCGDAKKTANHEVLHIRTHWMYFYTLFLDNQILIEPYEPKKSAKRRKQLSIFLNLLRKNQGTTFLK